MFKEQFRKTHFICVLNICFNIFIKKIYLLKCQISTGSLAN